MIICHLPNNDGAQGYENKTFEAFVGDDPVISYVGIRADENREGYKSNKETIQPVFPFVEDGIMRGCI